MSFDRNRRGRGRDKRDGFGEDSFGGFDNSPSFGGGERSGGYNDRGGFGGGAPRGGGYGGGGDRGGFGGGAPRGGGVIKSDWWSLWPRDAYPPMDYIVASIDTAYTTKTENDYSAMTVWGIFSGDLDSASADNWSDKDGNRRRN